MALLHNNRRAPTTLGANDELEVELQLAKQRLQ